MFASTRSSKVALALAVAITAGFASHASAAIVSVVSAQYRTNGSPLVGTDTAGVVPETNYNVINLGYVNPGQNGVTTGLVDSTGASVSGLSITTVSDGGYDHGSGISSTNTGDQNLYSGFALGGYGGVASIDIAIAGLDATHDYTLYTYVGSLFGPGAIVEGTVGTQSYYLTTATTSYTQGTATTYASSADGNYFEFDGLTGSSAFTYHMVSPGSGGVGDSGSGFAVYGLQIVDNGVASTPPSTPEPATLSVLALGAGALLMKSRRR